MTKHEKALNDLIDAWESLEGGGSHRPATVESWLRERMSPAVNAARKIIGRKRPDEL